MNSLRPCRSQQWIRVRVVIVVVLPAKSSATVQWRSYHNTLLFDLKHTASWIIEMKQTRICLWWQVMKRYLHHHGSRQAQDNKTMVGSWKGKQIWEIFDFANAIFSLSCDISRKLHTKRSGVPYNMHFMTICFLNLRQAFSDCYMLLICLRP